MSVLLTAYTQLFRQATPHSNRALLSLQANIKWGDVTETSSVYTSEIPCVQLVHHIPPTINAQLLFNTDNPYP